MLGFELKGHFQHGKKNLEAGRNNQDGAYMENFEGNLILVVTDGCSCGTYKSEVGSRLGVHIVTNAIKKNFSLFKEDKSLFLNEVKRSILEVLVTLCQIVPVYNNYNNTINEFLLFTFVGCIISPEETVIFSFGDGNYCLNDKEVKIDYAGKNKPMYISMLLISVTLKFALP